MKLQQKKFYSVIRGKKLPKFYLIINLIQWLVIYAKKQTNKQNNMSDLLYGCRAITRIQVTFETPARQQVLLLIWSTLEGLNAESFMKPFSGFELWSGNLAP